MYYSLLYYLHKIKKKSLSDSSKNENDEALQKVEKEKLLKTFNKGYELIGGK